MYPPLGQELSSHRKQGPGFLSRMGETVRAVANSVRGVKGRPEEFTLMQDYVDDFSNKISSVDKVTQRIIREQRGGRGEKDETVIIRCLCVFFHQLEIAGFPSLCYFVNFGICGPVKSISFFQMPF